MAYERRYRVAFLIAAMTTAIVASFQHINDTWSDFSENFLRITGAIDWPSFIPTGRESIALDVAARELVDHRQPGIASRFAEFLKRAITHDEFTADHYDPGWRPA